MILIENIRSILLSYYEMVESTHFEKISFCYRKKIVAAFDSKKEQLTVKLSLIDQDVFVKSFPNSIQQIPNSWGKKGWTYVDVNSIPIEVFQDICQLSYVEVSKRKSNQTR
jgi:hypothetical protein